ncbi:sulfite exporter TauE/SafE family protein [Vibrio methylphosphonaticus]|uniref:sulfite exporter TauE/SafE family protein n=1 Tax=Vibrio methylphosphonaticus TaxID=2946866 RepID=UPI00202A96EE|nr:sulfite exporter TauE/SafE family protein [Vibrio methylphosphonaticus]MCL9776804.1 sulfite exporter TauE/SafE family protein [Vibrio methylphosphonaticus]
MTLDLLGAFTIGLLGAGHCMGMCGGIASLLSIGQPHNTPTLLIINYNLGRLISYVMIGSVVGGMIAGIATLSQFNHALSLLRILAALFMILLALYVGRWWNGLLKVEKLGQLLWKSISPLANKLLPLKHSSYAIPFGFLWGWLPCGLVYSTLTWAAVSGSALGGAMTMLAFGLGTLPAMLLVGSSAAKLQSLQNSAKFRNIAAFSILIYGLYTGYDAVTIFNAN